MGTHFQKILKVVKVGQAGWSTTKKSDFDWSAETCLVEKTK